MADYPEMITDLPRADIPFSGVRGWILQGEEKQVIFLDIDPIGEVAEHSHRRRNEFDYWRRNQTVWKRRYLLCPGRCSALGCFSQRLQGD